MKSAILFMCVVSLACGSDSGDGNPTGPFLGRHADTVELGDVDNVESIRVIPGSPLAIALSSKAHRLVLFEVVDDELVKLRAATLDTALDGESETTNFALGPDGSWAAITRTIVESDSNDTVTSCAGELLIVNTADFDDFGTIISRIPTGPMPDAVAVTSDGELIVVANERDVVWGKCADVENLDEPSVTIARFDGTSVVEELRLELEGEREPEAVAIWTDDDLVGITLQDSHELLTFRLSEVLSSSTPQTELTISRLPTNAIDQEAWPDGVTAFEMDGQPHFAVAGEANDTVLILDDTGAVAKTLEVSASLLPSDYPRDGSWGPLFQPDSIATFSWNQTTHLSVSLKSAGAVAIWEVGPASSSWDFRSVKIGNTDELGSGVVSVVGAEGIAASSSHGFIVTANEVESSVSLIVPQ